MSSISDWISESVPEHAMEDAAAWVARLDSERCNSADLLAFARWLGEEPRHRWAFQDLSEVWARLRTLADVGPMLDDPKVRRLPTPVHVATTGGDAVHRDWSALAVSATLFVGVALNLFISTPVHHYSTGAGEIIDVELADGSRLELNARTRLEVRIDDRTREIGLLSGEAVFHVTPDRRPFVVATDRGTVSAKGTSFAVANNADRLEVAVLEGSVSVRPSVRDHPLNEYDGDSGLRLADESALLGAGDFASVTRETINIGTASYRALERMLSWRNGVVEFRDQRLSAVVDEMGRYVNVRVHIADADLAQSLVTETFRAGDSDAYLNRLSALKNVRVDRATDGWVVLRPAGDNVGDNIGDNIRE